jgi:L-glyceraldehyde reductase
VIAPPAFAKEKGIHLTAYSPLGKYVFHFPLLRHSASVHRLTSLRTSSNVTGKPRVIDDEHVQKIAKRANRDPAQILIAWGAHKGYSVIPKSVTPSRIESNFSE